MKKNLLTIFVSLVLLKHSPIASIAQQQIMHPPSILNYHKRGTKIDKIQSFISDTQLWSAENIKIPPKTTHIFRIMTYNVHNWKDPFNKWNYNNIFHIIKKLSPDILILQEVTIHGTIPYFKIYNDLHTEGFVFESISCNTFKKKFLGNIIMTKISPKSSTRGWYKKQERPSQENRCWVSMDFILPNGNPLTIYGTHLEFGHTKSYSHHKKESIRQQQIQELIDHIKNNNKKNILIAGDFNAIRKEDHLYSVEEITAWDFLKKAWNIKGEIPTYTLDTLKKERFKDSFSFINWQLPKFTVWAGIVIDFIFLAPLWQLPIAGSYMYYDAASDHLPIIMDIKID